MAGNRQSPTRGRSQQSGSAFLVESMVLLVFLTVAVAVAIQLFSGALERAGNGENLSRAVAAGSEVAERFAADPIATSGAFVVEGMDVTCTVTEEATGHGTLYHATIDVLGKTGSERSAENTAPMYSISTSRYVSEVVR